MWSEIILWIVGLMEFLICFYFCAYIALYAVPWGELREKRDISRGIAMRLPALRARTRHAAKRAAAAPLIRNPVHLRVLCGQMTDDIVDLSAHCVRLVGTIEREHRTWPREMLLLEDVLSRTLEVLERTCAMRNAQLPVLAKAYAKMAAARILHVDAMRQHLLARIDALASSGACYDRERHCLTMLGNALQAHGQIAESDPARVIEVSFRWVARLKLVAESIELRAVAQRRLAEVRAEFPERAERVRMLLGSVQTLLPVLRTTSAHKSVALRMVVLESAEQGIAQAERELSLAEAFCRTSGVDLGASGQSGRGLAEALRSAARAHATLSGFEDDLAFIAAIAAANKGEDSGEVN